MFKFLFVQEKNKRKPPFYFFQGPRCEDVYQQCFRPVCLWPCQLLQTMFIFVTNSIKN